MKAEMITIDWSMLGAKLASLGSEDQARFFQGFAFEMDSYETTYKRQLQMMYVRDGLSKKEKGILEECLSCLWFEEEA